MAQWNDFPGEIQLAILSFCCNDIVAEFRNSLKSNSLSQHPYNLVRQLKNLVWPETPQSLKSFASVLKTCRNVYHIVSNEVRVEENSSPGQILQRLQYAGMGKLERALHSSRQYPYSMLDESCYIHFMYRILGCFWKNPIAFDEDNRFGWLLRRIPQRSRLILIPHLQPWLLYETAKADEAGTPDASEDEDEDEEFDGDDCPWSEEPAIDSDRGLTLTVGVSGNLDHCRHLKLEQGTFSTFEEPLAIVSIAGLATDSAEKEIDSHKPAHPNFDRNCYPDLPVLCDVRDDEPDTWWLFPPEDFYPAKVKGEDCGLAENENHWFLVNYERRMLYMGPGGYEAYYWDDVWDIPAKQPQPLTTSSRTGPKLRDKGVQTESCLSLGE